MWTGGRIPGFSNCFVSFGNRSEQLVLSQDACGCVHITDVFACLLNLPENCLLPDYYHSMINLFRPLWCIPTLYWNAATSEVRRETAYDRARKLSPPGKDEADETDVSRLESLPPLWLRRVWTSGCPFLVSLPTVPWFQPHVTRCPVRFKVLSVKLIKPRCCSRKSFSLETDVPGFKSWLHHEWRETLVESHLTCVSACFPVKGDDGVHFG